MVKITFIDLTQEPEPEAPVRVKDAPFCQICEDRRVSIYRIGADSKTKIFDLLCGICSDGVGREGYRKFVPKHPQPAIDSYAIAVQEDVKTEFAPGRTPIEVLVLEFLFPFEFIPAQIGKMGFGGRLGRYYNPGNGRYPELEKLDFIQTDLLDWWIATPEPE